MRFSVSEGYNYGDSITSVAIIRFPVSTWLYLTVVVTDIFQSWRHWCINYYSSLWIERTFNATGNKLGNIANWKETNVVTEEISGQYNGGVQKMCNYFTFSWLQKYSSMPLLPFFYFWSYTPSPTLVQWCTEGGGGGAHPQRTKIFSISCNFRKFSNVLSWRPEILNPLTLDEWLHWFKTHLVFQECMGTVMASRKHQQQETGLHIAFCTSEEMNVKISSNRTCSESHTSPVLSIKSKSFQGCAKDDCWDLQLFLSFLALRSGIWVFPQNRWNWQQWQYWQHRLYYVKTKKKSS